MKSDEKDIVQIIARAADMLPDEGRRYIIGYAEAVIDMREGAQAKQAQGSA